MSRFARSLAVAVLLVVTTVASAHAVNDHLKCYKIKDPVNLAAVVDLDAPQIGLDEAACKVSRAQMFCVPATKTVLSAEDKKTHVPITPLPVGGPDPGDRVCYKVKCPAPFPPDTQVTDQFGTRTVTKFTTSMLCTPAVMGSVPPRFVDNGDGTVTDNQTGLQWEKKVSPGGGVGDPHDVDNFYSWNEFMNNSGTGIFNQLNNCTSSDGTAVTTPGFAGHCDWRLPTIQELKSIVDLTQGHCGGGSGPCIDPIFGPTLADNYWSATNLAGSPNITWYVFFFSGIAGLDGKTNHNYVRAVRTGS